MPRPGDAALWRLAAAIAAAATLVQAALVPGGAWDWQPGLATVEPWRWLTAAAVHWSWPHRLGNLAALALLAALGSAAGCGRREALAWALAVPASHLALLGQPGLAHFGGLSGALHAGVAVVAVRLLWLGEAARRADGAGGVPPSGSPRMPPREPWREPSRVSPLVHPRGPARAVGAALAAGLVLKLLAESAAGQAWGAPLPPLADGVGYAPVPLVHLGGALAGVLCAALIRPQPAARAAPPGTPPDTPRRRAASPRT